MATALPPRAQAEEDYPLLKNHSELLSAYDLVLEAERHAVARSDRSATTDSIHARIVGWLLLNPVGPNPALFVHEISSANSREVAIGQIYELGCLYMNHIIPLFKKHRLATPRASTHPSRSFFDTLRNDIVANCLPSPKDHRTTQALALIRDDFRCMVTGVVDMASYGHKLVKGPRPSQTTETECAHIFPESLGFLEGKDPERQKQFVVTAYNMLNRFGYTNIEQELAGTKFHRLENVLTLEHSLHTAFDQLNLWFDAVPNEPDTYRVITHDPFIPGPSFPAQVTFISHDNLPLPSPKYLRIHVACCRIAHMSGAAEYIDQIYRDEEELPVLASDGTSAPVLEHFLQRLVAPG